LIIKTLQSMEGKIIRKWFWYLVSFVYGIACVGSITPPHPDVPYAVQCMVATTMLVALWMLG